MRELEGKVALVTGGSRGIGRAIGVALGQRGAKVVLNYTSNETAAAEAAAAVVAAGGAAVTKRFDVADPAAVDAAFKEVVAAEGGLQPEGALMADEGRIAGRLAHHQRPGLGQDIA